MNAFGQKLGRVLIPMVTPFHEASEDINFPLAEQLVDHLIATNACDTIIVAGTTGEFNVLLPEERIELMRVVQSAAAGRVPLVAGTGAASTREAVRLTKEAERLGYSAAMIVAPYYCKPTQEGIYRHYARLAASTEIPILLYNIPLFTGVNIDPQTVARLSKIDTIVGIKDEAGLNPTQMTEYRRVAGNDFTIYNGDDIMILCGLIQGAAGVVSGGAHLAPRHIRTMIESFYAGDMAKAAAIHHALDPLFKAFCPNHRVNPMPVLRAALELTGWKVGPARMPLDAATPDEIAAIQQELIRLNIL